MDRMFRVLGFWTLIIALMFLAGQMIVPAILFTIQTVLFIGLGYLKLTEKTYMYLFGGYMFLSFCGLVWYSTFVLN